MEDHLSQNIQQDTAIVLGAVPVISVVPKSRQFIADLAFRVTTAKITYTAVSDGGYETTEERFVFDCAPTIFKNLGISAEGKDDYLKPAHSKLSPVELAQIAFKGTPFLDPLLVPASITLTPQKRAEHSHCLARTGHGKSATLFQIVKEDIDEGTASVIVIEPKGDLVRDISYLSAFAHSNRLQIIDPKYTPACNFFALHERLASYPDNQKRQLVANIISQYSQALSALDAETSINQRTALAYVVELVFAMNGTIWDFLSIIEDPARDYDKSTVVPPFMEYIKSADRDFFINQFYGGMVPVSRKSLGMKIRFLMKSAPQFESMFGANTSKIDLYERMQTPGSVTLINTSEGTLTPDASSFFGRLMLSQILNGALERQATHAITHPVYVVVDEAHLYIDQNIEKFLLQTRSAKVGITLAHQQLKDLKAARDTVVQQPAIKIAAPSSEDEGAMARAMRGGTEIFDGLNTGQFAIHFRPMPAALKITIPNTIRSAPRMTAGEHKELVGRNYQHFKDGPRTPRERPHIPTETEPKPNIKTPEQSGTAPKEKVELGEAD